MHGVGSQSLSTRAFQASFVTRDYEFRGHNSRWVRVVSLGLTGSCLLSVSSSSFFKGHASPLTGAVIGRSSTLSIQAQPSAAGPLLGPYINEAVPSTRPADLHLNQAIVSTKVCAQNKVTPVVAWYQTSRGCTSKVRGQENSTMVAEFPFSSSRSSKTSFNPSSEPVSNPLQGQSSRQGGEW